MAQRPIIRDTFTVNPDGGQVRIDLAFETAHLATYILTARTAVHNEPIFRKEGDNVSLEDDSYFLPSPPTVLVGGRLFLFANVIKLDDPDGPYTITLTATQGDVELDGSPLRVTAQSIGSNIVTEVMVVRFE